MTAQTYTLPEIRNGTGFAKGVRFAIVHEEVAELARRVAIARASQLSDFVNTRARVYLGRQDGRGVAYWVAQHIENAVARGTGDKIGMVY